MSDRDDLHAEIRRLRDRLDLLEEENRQLRENAKLTFQAPAEWRLTNKENAFFAALHQARGQVLPLERILVAVYGNEVDVSDRIVSVMVLKLRRKLQPFGVDIRTAWGIGYSLAVDDFDHLPTIPKLKAVA
ncbi:helix-turn-helix domain-containing protein [Methylobacterium sp. WCS2018Hpa-22]|uniref:helix-turn-helix domain-containing protein n=1 Tax=Methylobacterium sp. WCS2018Hpa-22 TaxID=3073633 RepID=UPI0028895E14|nr:helix-turn-helix domain-containing protein [Methylobacterium sp. WCS2018Hpa-22]